MGWDELKTSVSHLAQTAAQKTEELADTAALHLRAGEMRGNLEEAYEGLGRLMYARLRDGVDNTTDIDAVMSRIDTLEKELEAIKAKLEAKKNGGP